jgi:hypothetical protein
VISPTLRALSVLVVVPALSLSSPPHAASERTSEATRAVRRRVTEVFD